LAQGAAVLVGLAASGPSVGLTSVYA
jgi:hypothetical protein